MGLICGVVFERKPTGYTLFAGFDPKTRKPLIELPRGSIWQSRSAGVCSFVLPSLQDIDVNSLVATGFNNASGRNNHVSLGVSGAISPPEVQSIYAAEPYDSFGNLLDEAFTFLTNSDIIVAKVTPCHAHSQQHKQELLTGIGFLPKYRVSLFRLNPAMQFPDSAVYEYNRAWRY